MWEPRLQSFVTQSCNGSGATATRHLTGKTSA
jgi:hypothetical protein